jgi:hypothetical protein
MMRSVRFGPACLTLLLAALIGGLTPVAYASPPDPSWVRGVYDDADFDDVVGPLQGALASCRPSSRSTCDQTAFASLPLYRLRITP